MYHVQNRSDSVAKRAERQRQVVAAIMEKLSGGTLRDMLGLLDYCSMKVKTNLPLSKLVSYASAAASGVELGGSGAVPFTANGNMCVTETSPQKSVILTRLRG